MSLQARSMALLFSEEITPDDVTKTIALANLRISSELPGVGYISLDEPRTVKGSETLIGFPLVADEACWNGMKNSSTQVINPNKLGVLLDFEPHLELPATASA